MSSNLLHSVICGYFVNQKYNKETIFKDWLDNVREYYLVDTFRKFVIYTDNQNLTSHNLDDLKIIHVNDDFSDIGENRLKKMKFLNMLCDTEITEETDFVSFFQSNLRCCKHVYSYELVKSDTGISAPFHPEFQRDKNFKKHIRNNLISKNSVANIDNIDVGKYTYFQNGHIIGRPESFRDVVQRTMNLIEMDKTNGVKIDGQPFDERYFNIVVNSNEFPWKVMALDSNIYITAERQTRKTSKSAN